MIRMLHEIQLGTYVQWEILYHSLEFDFFKGGQVGLGRSPILFKQASVRSVPDTQAAGTIYNIILLSTVTPNLPNSIYIRLTDPPLFIYTPVLGYFQVERLVLMKAANPTL